MIISNQLESSDQSAEFSLENSVFDAFFVTSKGGRKENQDTFGYIKATDGSHVFCVADGLGGHAGGRVASQVAVQAVNDFMTTSEYKFADPQMLIKSFELANKAIFSKQKEMPELSNMRSTLVILVVKDNLAFWGHVGDVRLYLFSGGAIKVQTKDHSVPQMLVDTGEIEYEDIRSHPDRSRLLNALGSAGKAVKVSIPQQYSQLQVGDRFHLSTDGFWEWILENEMLSFFNESATLMEQSRLMQLHVVRNAQEKESEHDNLTALNLVIKTAELNREYWSKTQYKIKDVK